MANDIFGGELNIQGLEDGIDRIEKKMTNLSRNFTTNSNKIINAFRDINANGVQQLVNKLGELQTALTNISSKNANLGNVGSGASKSVDEITKLTDALAKLKAINSLKLKTDKAKRDYLKEANDIKEVVIQEKERTRELERQNKLNIELNNKRLTVDKKGESNLIRQEMNAQRQKERALIEADAKDKARHKDRMVRLRQQLDEINRLAKAYKAMPTNISTKSVGGLIGQSVNATSINQRITAINNMKNALRDLDTTTEKGKRTEEYLTSEIKRQTKELKKQGVNLDEVKKRKHSLMNTTDQLQRKLALLFSVSAIQGYVNTLVKYRGEFEMQNKALQVLLQNKDEANKLWDQTVKLAVKSPFTVKQLVTYTKQLAAYRIESDKLYETNKMLADVSAGLGVDMQRLILAYGQVKAANFLRGTELRQFSEAGVNMLDELAKRFTELEGRTVSVGEVFDRVSKRMVSFKDVEAVLKNLTSKGGLFYQMQEKQAETLAGQLSNLRDVYQLMLNDIGRDQEGIIKGSIQGLMQLLKNWRMVAPAIETALYAYITFLSLKGLTKLINGTKLLVQNLINVATASNKASKALSGIGGKTGGIVMLISLVVSLGYAIYETINASDEFQNEFNVIDREILKDLDASISKYRELADTLKVAKKGTKEYSETVADLKRHFADILPDEMLQVKNIRQMEQGYKDATEAIKLFYTTQASERKKAKALETLEEGLSDDINEFVSDFSKKLQAKAGKVIKVYHADGSREHLMFPKELADDIKAGYINALNKAIDSAKNGEIAATEETLMNEFYKNLSQFTGVDAQKLYEMLYSGSAYFTHQFEDMADDLSAYRNAVGDIDKQATSYETRPMQKQRLEYEKQKVALDELTATYDKLKRNYQEYKELVDKEKEGGKIDKDIKANLEKEIAEGYKNLGVEVAIKPSFVSVEPVFDFSKMIVNQNVLDDELRRIGQTAYDTFSKNISTPVEKATANMSDFSLAAYAAGKNVEPINLLEMPNFFQKLPTVAKNLQGVSSASKRLSEEATELSKSLDSTEIQKYTNKAISYISKTYGVSESLFDKLRATNEDSFTTMDDKVKTYGESLIERITAIKVFLANNPLVIDVTTYLPQFGTTSAEWDKFKGMSKEEIEKMVKKFRALFGGSERPTRGRKSDPAKELAKVMQDMFREYEKMNDKFSDETSKKDVATYFKQTFEEAAKQVKGFNLALDKFDFTTFDGLINALTTLKGFTKDEKTGREIGQIISNLQTEKETTKIDKTIEAREREVELLYEQYDLYKDLKKQGSSTALAKNLFNIDVTNIDELAKGIKEIFTQKHGSDSEWGEDIVKAYQDAMDKIAKMGKDARVEQLKQYVKLERDGFSERIKAYLESSDKQKEIDETFAPSTEMLVKFNIKKEELSTIQDLFKNYLEDGIVNFNSLGLTGEQINDLKVYFEYLKEGKKYAQDGIDKVLQESLVDIEIKEFKDSSLYDIVFGDFEKLSKASIQIVKEKLKGLQTQLKDAGVVDDAKLQELLNKLNDAERKAAGVWTTYKEDKKAVKATYDNQLYKDYRKEGGKETGVNAWIKIYADELTKVARLEKEIADLTKERENIGGNLNGNQQKQLTNARKELNDAKENVTTAEENIEKHKKLTDSQKNLIKSGQAWGDALMNVLGNADQLADALGQSEDSSARMVIKMLQGFISIGMQILSLIVSLEAMGLALNSALGIIGLIGIALSAIVTAVSIFASSADDTEKINAEIERQQQLVDRLNREYDRLQKNLDKMSTFAGFQKMSESIENLRKQQRAYERMIDLEYSKKDSDASKIQEYIGNITDIAEKIADVYEDLRNTLIDDFKDISEELADAMLSALKEGEDAISAWGESVDEIVQNLVKKIVVAKLIEPEVEKLIDEYYNSLMPRTSKAEEWAKAETEATAIWEKYAKAYANIPSDKDAGSWSDLIGADLYNIMAKLDKQKNVTFDEFYEAVKDFLPQFTKDQIRSIFKQRAWDEYGNWSIHLGDTLVALLSLMTQTAKAEKDNAQKKHDEAERAAEGEEVTFNQEASDKLSEELEKLGTDVFDQLPDYVKAMFEESASSLTGLQKGIQGITESTAQVLEGYLNSIRFYVAQDNGNLNRIVEMLTTYTTTNPILSELKAQTEVVRSIRDMFAGVIRSGHPTFGGSFIKVAL